MRPPESPVVAMVSPAFTRSLFLAEQLLVMPVQAQVAVAVVDDDQQPAARQPIGVGRRVLPARRAHHCRVSASISMPSERKPPTMGIAVVHCDAPGHRPGQAAPLPREGCIGIEGHGFDGFGQALQQPLQVLPVLLQARQLVRAAPGFLFQGSQHQATLPAGHRRALQPESFCCCSRARQFGIFCIDIGGKFFDFGNILIQLRDLPRPHAAKIAVNTSNCG